MSRFFLLLSIMAVAATAYSPIKPATSSTSASTPLLSRRNVLASAAVALGTSPLWTDPSMASAKDNGLVDYQDEEFKFSIKVPSDWQKSVQSLPDRRKIVLYIKPDSDQKTLMFFAYTPVRGDFTSLGSFGSVDEVGQSTILPKSELAGVADVDSKMLSSESKKQAYFFDYVQKIPSQPKTHFQAIFSLAPAAANTSGNTLVTITVQTPESEFETMEPLFNDIINSYNK